jgi:hypothetical protein
VVFASPVHFVRVSESSICLDAKEIKIIHGLLLFFGIYESSISLPENTKLKNYLKVPLHSPSRSPFRLNSRSTATSIILCFLTFLI